MTGSTFQQYIPALVRYLLPSFLFRPVVSSKHYVDNIHKSNKTKLYSSF